ncbi:MAG: DbpA RNA binding domain-containing protein, partial [Methylococcales bacterium]
KPGTIVRMLAGEMGIETQLIGRIDIQDHYTTVDLLEGIPNEVFRGLEKTWLAGQPLKFSRLETYSSAGASPLKQFSKPKKKFSDTKKAGGKRR